MEEVRLLVRLLVRLTPRGPAASKFSTRTGDLTVPLLPPVRVAASTQNFLGLLLTPVPRDSLRILARGDFRFS